MHLEWDEQHGFYAIQCFACAYIAAYVSPTDGITLAAGTAPTTANPGALRYPALPDKKIESPEPKPGELLPI